MFTALFQKLTFAIFSLGGSSGKNRGRKQFDPNKLGQEPKFRVNNNVIKNLALLITIGKCCRNILIVTTLKHSTFSKVILVSRTLC